MANISSYNQLSSWNEDDDLLFVQQPDAPKKAHPSQMKEYILEGLDVSSVGGTGKYISEISEADGKINATAETMDVTPTKGSSKLVKSGGIKTAIDDSVSLKTATGNPITLTDAANANAEELSITIEPIQDLHGYSKPWAGGGGKNLFNVNTTPIEESSVSLETNTSLGQIKMIATGTSGWQQARIPLTLNNGTYTLSITAETTSSPFSGSQRVLLFNETTKTGFSLDSENKIPFTVNNNSWSILTRLNQITNASVGEYAVWSGIQVEVGTSATTFEPWENICPISGLTSGEVETTDGTDTNTATITLGQTVYGGSVNFKTGEVTVTHGYVEYDGSEDEAWNPLSTQAGTTYRMRILPPTNIKLPEGNYAPVSAISNQYLVLSANDVYTQHTGLSVQYDGGYLAVYDVNYNREDSVSAWKTHLASVPLTVCYELATPTTLTLTPAELELLKGNNTVSGNGAEISIEYYPDNAIGALAGRVDDKADITYVNNAVATKANITDVNAIKNRDLRLSLNDFTNNGARTIYESVLAYINSLSASDKPIRNVSFYLTYIENTMPRDLPANTIRWNYSYGEIIFRHNQYVDATIILYPYSTADDASPVIKHVFNGIQGTWHTVLTDKSGATKTYVDNAVNRKVEIQNNAGFHNSIYRGKYLGSEVTAEQYAAIAAGTFDDMYIGDYWTIDGVNYRIAAFDYWLHCGDRECTTHHVVLVPDTNLDTQKMNDSNVTTGGYVGSKMYTSYITTARNKVISAFGSANILSHRQLFSNTVDGNYASNWSWYDSTIDLMSESMVYGAPIGGKAKVDSINFNIGIDKVQLPLFALDPSRITNRAGWWLRGVVSSADFALVGATGDAGRYSASDSHGVRPAFGIKA